MVKWRRCDGTPPIVQNLFLGEIQPLRHGFAVPPPQIRGDIRAAFSHKKTRAIIRTAM